MHHVKVFSSIIASFLWRQSAGAARKSGGKFDHVGTPLCATDSRTCTRHPGHRRCLQGARRQRTSDDTFICLLAKAHPLSPPIGERTRPQTWPAATFALVHSSFLVGSKICTSGKFSQLQRTGVETTAEFVRLRPSGERHGAFDRKLCEWQHLE